MSKKFEKFTKEYGIIGLINQLKSGQINRDAEMQRGYVWGNKDQTEFLDSIFQSNIYIPPVIGSESDSEIDVKGKVERVIDLLDGKQRTTTLEMFVDDKIKLGNNIMPVEIEQEDGETKEYPIAGLIWSEIPEAVKNVFKSAKINMIFFKGMTEEDKERQFIKLQGGKRLTNAEVNKVRIGKNLREFIYKQLAEEFWTKYSKVSNNREARFETMQHVIMLMNGETNLSGKNLQEFADDAEIDQDILDKIEDTTMYLNNVARQIKLNMLPETMRTLTEDQIMEKLDNAQTKKFIAPIEFMKKVHVPIIYKTASMAIENGMTVNGFAEFITEFFNDVDASYKRKSEGKSADASNVMGRMEIMEGKLNKYIEQGNKIVA